METEHVAALGKAIRTRREELDLTQDDLAGRGGPSNTTVSAIEQGKASTVAPVTLRKIDKALGWQTGSARSILRGEAVGGDVQDASTATEDGGRENQTLLFQRPEGISDARWSELRGRASAYLQGLLDAAADER